MGARVSVPIAGNQVGGGGVVVDGKHACYAVGLAEAATGVVVFGFEFPVLVEAVFDAGEQVERTVAAVRPICGGVVFRAEGGGITLAVVHGVAERRVGGFFRLLVVHACVDAGLRCDVVFQYAVELGIAAAFALPPRVAPLEGGNQAAAQRAFGVQAARYVRAQPEMFAVARFGADFKQWFAGRAFAYQIDGGGRLARAVQQPRRAAHDFYALIGGGVGIARIGQRIGNGDAVDLVVGDAAAAREQVVVARAVGAVNLAAGTGRLQQGTVERFDVLVAHLLRCDDADALRDFAQGHGQPERGVRAGNGVAVVGTRGAVGGNGDGGQFGAFLRFGVV